MATVVVVDAVAVAMAAAGEVAAKAATAVAAVKAAAAAVMVAAVRAAVAMVEAAAAAKAVFVAPTALAPAEAVAAAAEAMAAVTVAAEIATEPLFRSTPESSFGSFFVFTLETAVGWARRCHDLGARQDETTPTRKEEQRRMAP